MSRPDEAVVYGDKITIYTQGPDVTIRLGSSDTTNAHYTAALRANGWRLSGSWGFKNTAYGRCPIAEVVRA